VLEQRGVAVREVRLHSSAQWYEQFLHVGRLLYWAVILLGFVLSSEYLRIFGLHNAIHI